MRDKIEEIAARELERWNAPGLEVAVVKEGEVVFTGGFGKRDVERDLPVTSRTLFHHGSTGKAFTGVLAASLVDEGLLSWGKPLQRYVPSLRFSDPVATQRVTLADLLSHRSGLARHEWMWIANPSWNREDIVRRLEHLEMNKDLRTTFQYCNVGYATAGYVVEAVTGSTWSEQLKERVLGPLEMTRTMTSLGDMQQSDDYAAPYEERDGKATRIEFRATDTIAPAGGVMSCAEDTARWLLFHLGDGKPVLSDGTLAITQAIHIGADMPTPDPEVHYFGYALGWIVGTYRGRRMLWHNGGIDGFYTEFVVIPSEKLGIATCSNGGHTTGLPTAVAYQIADLLLGEEGKDWSAVIRERHAEPTPDEEQNVVGGTSPSHALEEFAGTYEHPGYGRVVVSVDGEGLNVELGELKVTSKHRHYDTWDLDYEPLADSWPLSFVTNIDGQIAEAVIAFDPSVAPIRFARGDA
jgi:CubicO group peptidase (beta-lactamase class C family)